MVWKPDKKTKKKNRNIQEGGSIAPLYSKLDNRQDFITRFNSLPPKLQAIILRNNFNPEELIRLRKLLYRNSRLTGRRQTGSRRPTTRKRSTKKPRNTNVNLDKLRKEQRAAKQERERVARQQLAAQQEFAAQQEKRFAELCMEEFLSKVSDPVDISIVYEIADAINNNNKKVTPDDSRFKPSDRGFKSGDRRNKSSKSSEPYPARSYRSPARGNRSRSSARGYRSRSPIRDLPPNEDRRAYGKKSRKRNKNKKSKKNSKKKVNDLKGGAYSEFRDVVTKINSPTDLDKLKGNEIYKLFGLVHIISDMTHDNKLPIGEYYSGGYTDCIEYDSNTDGCWNFPFNTLIRPSAGFSGFYKTYNTLIGDSISISGSEDNLFEYSLKNSLFDKREFKIYPLEGEESIKINEYHNYGGLKSTDNERITKSEKLRFKEKGINDCLGYVRDSMLENHILTTDAGGMMSFIRSFDPSNSNVVTENTLLQMFDSASGESVSGNKINAVGNNLLFRKARDKFIELFEGCLDLPGFKPISLKKAIPILSIEDGGIYYYFEDEDGSYNIDKRMPYFKMSLNKLSVSAGFGTIRGDADIGGDDPAVQQHKEFLNMSAMNVGINDFNDSYEPYIRKLSKLLKYMGDFLQVLSTNTVIDEKTPILYTGDRLCFIAGLLFKDPEQYKGPEQYIKDFPNTIYEYLRTDTYYTGEGNNRKMIPYNNYKTFYMSFRGTRNSGKAFKINNYAHLVDEMSRTKDPIVDVSIIVQHSKSVDAELSTDKLIEIINKLRGDVITFYNQIGNIENIILPSELFLIDNGQLIPTDISEEPIEMTNVYQLNQVIQQQKDVVAVIDAERIKVQKEEKALNDFVTLRDVFSEVVDNLTIKTIFKEDVNSILKIENLENRQEVYFKLNDDTIEQFKELMELIVNNIKKDVTKKYIEKKINSAVNVAESYYAYYPSNENPLLEKPTIVITGTRSAGRFYRIEIKNSFAAILAYSNREKFIKA